MLAGTALALSAEKRAARGMNSWEIDKGILIRGAIIAALDPTLISLGSCHWNIGVLYAIGVSMMAMALLRHMATLPLVILSLTWIFFGEWVTELVWNPPGSSSPIAALFMASYASPDLLIHYPMIPWLALMMLGWVLGRHIVSFKAGTAKISPEKILWITGIFALIIFFVVRGFNGYGNMFLYRTDNSWQQWLHVSKYPPSLSYYALECGLLAIILAFLMRIEPVIGVRQKGPILVFGQTAMFYYLLHRLVLETSATYFNVHGFGDISTTYITWALMVVPLYYTCLWYRKVKTSHPQSLLRYF
ncbi:MAG: heparan-alpha-glucosaminide N-acetyltransferase domain-containing protein [Bacteroidales bacterium]